MTVKIEELQYLIDINDAELDAVKGGYVSTINYFYLKALIEDRPNTARPEDLSLSLQIQMAAPRVTALKNGESQR